MKYRCTARADINYLLVFLMLKRLQFVQFLNTNVNILNWCMLFCVNDDDDDDDDDDDNNNNYYYYYYYACCLCCF